MPNPTEYSLECPTKGAPNLFAPPPPNLQPLTAPLDSLNREGPQTALLRPLPLKVEAKAMVLEGFGMSADRKAWEASKHQQSSSGLANRRRQVTAGRVTIFPPELEEEQALQRSQLLQL